MASTLKVDTIDTPSGSGNISVSRPLSGSGASLTSLPAANLTGTLPAIDGSNLTGVGGAWTVIQSVVATDDATITCTGISSTYDSYCVTLSDMHPASDTAQPLLRMGDSSGIDTGASDYVFHLNRGTEASNSYGANSSTGAAFIELGGTTGTASGEGSCATLFINVPGDSTNYPTVIGNFMNWDESGVGKGGAIWGGRQAVIALTQIQFYYSTGNVATGRMTLYGIAHA